MAAPSLLVAILLYGPVLACQFTNDLFPTEKPFCTWECMTFALMWPGAFCAVRLEEVTGMQYTAKHPELDHTWTVLSRGTGEYGFPTQGGEEAIGKDCWKDEWIKHGTCAACVEGMNSPTRYFQATLKLRGRFDIDRALMDAGIKPSCNQTYQLEDLYSALDPIIGGRYEIQCLKNNEDRQLLAQVKILLFRNFTLGCNKNQRGEPTDAQTSWQASPEHPCPQDTPVYYYPISYQHPRDPCN